MKTPVFDDGGCSLIPDYLFGTKVRQFRALSKSRLLLSPSSGRSDRQLVVACHGLKSLFLRTSTSRLSSLATDRSVPTFPKIAIALNSPDIPIVCARAWSSRLTPVYSGTLSGSNPHRKHYLLEAGRNETLCGICLSLCSIPQTRCLPLHNWHPPSNPICQEAAARGRRAPT